MVMYYRDNRPANNYTAVSETPLEEYDEPHYASGEVEVRATSEKFIPHWNNGKPAPGALAYHPMSEATGLSPQFLRHLDNLSSGIESRRHADYALSSALDSHPDYLTKDEWEDAVNVVKNHPLANPDTLFTHIPKQVHVDGAFFDSSMRHTFPTVLGLIKQDYPEHEIVPSSDLSAHSSKLVKNAANKGLLGQDASPEDFDQTNMLTFRSRSLSADNIRDRTRDGEWAKIPTHEVVSARKGLKEMLAGAREQRKTKVAPHMSEQFNHPTLFD